MFLVLAINCLFNKEMLSYDSLVSTLPRYQCPSRQQASCVSQGPERDYNILPRRNLSEVYHLPSIMSEGIVIADLAKSKVHIMIEKIHFLPIRKISIICCKPRAVIKEFQFMQNSFI